MIDSYADGTNPCVFCGEDETDIPADRKEYLELSLCGNDTSLFVREVSVENFKNPKEDELPTSELSESPELTAATNPSVPLVPPTTSMRSIGNQSLRKKPSRTQKFDSLYTKKWSGLTYFEEEIRRLQELQYNSELSKAMERRKLWHSFQREILKDMRRDLTTRSGPEWWQAPSKKQIILATTLSDVIKADYEEEVTGRTRQWLLDLGVTTRLTPRQVRKCMKRSMLEPVDFLLEAHSVIVKFPVNVKKRGLQRPFSVDERLVLSAVCVLQLPTLLTMLHYLLPPPKPYPVDKHIQELLYGDLDDETIRYSTPYMEPLPFRNQVDFENWAFGKICNALLPILMQDSVAGPNFKRSLLSEKITSDPPQNNRGSAYSAAPSVAMLLSYCLSKRRASDSLKVAVDDESIHKRTFGRRLTFIGKSQNQKIPNEISKINKGDNPGAISLKSLETGESVQTVRETKTLGRQENTSPSTEQDHNEDFTFGNQHFQEDLKDNTGSYSELPNYADQNVDQVEGLDDSEIKALSKEYRRTISRNKMGDTNVLKSSSKTTEEEKSSCMKTSSNSLCNEQMSYGSLQQLKNIWEEIRACPEEQQLNQAIHVLKDMGDPLAQLPGIENLQTIQRWFELRRGKNRVLSKETIQELMKRSRGLWKSVKFSNSTKGPKVNISKRKERKLTWDGKKWLESEVKKAKQIYFTKIKQEKVDNARAFFPTMLNHYDHGSKLNRNFREVYYTYLPPREADTFAYRPWQPHETRSKNSC